MNDGAKVKAGFDCETLSLPLVNPGDGWPKSQVFL